MKIYMVSLLHRATINYREANKSEACLVDNSHGILSLRFKLECGPMPNVMAPLPNIGGALCSALQSLADAHYKSAVQ